MGPCTSCHSTSLNSHAEFVKQLPSTLEYLGWRSVAIIDKPRFSKVTDDKTSDMDAIMHEAEEVRIRVEAMLSSEENRVGNALTQENIPKLMEPTGDFRSYNQYLLKRVRLANSVSSVRMHIVWWKTLAELGRFPMYPDIADSAHIIDAEKLVETWIEQQDETGKVEGRALCISFFSHRWERPSMDPLQAHPDSLEHKKAFALSKYGEFGFCSVFSPVHYFEYYFWVDFAGINQYNLREKCLGVSALCAFVAASVEIVMYNSFTSDYEPRAWTRVERMLGFTYCACPLFVYLDDNYPRTHVDIDQVVRENPGAFAKDEQGGLVLKLRDPSSDGAMVRSEQDAQWINNLTGTVMKAVPLNPARVWNHIHCLEFGKTMVPIDIEHYQNDVKAANLQQNMERFHMLSPST